jgi:hypothetical protein
MKTLLLAVLISVPGFAHAADVRVPTATPGHIAPLPHIIPPSLPNPHSVAPKPISLPLRNK